MATTADMRSGLIIKVDGSLYTVIEFGQNKTARAAAKVSLQRLLDLSVIRLRAPHPQRVERHDEARRAEAALRAVEVDHRLLHRVQLAVTGCEKLDRYDVLVLDDLGYVRKDQAETTVLFELIAERYERKSLITTCNQPFSEWNQIFPDPAMTVAAIDRLVHHATILELNTESYRRRSALTRGAKLAASQLPAKVVSPPA